MVYTITEVKSVGMIDRGKIQQSQERPLPYLKIVLLSKEKNRDIICLSKTEELRSILHRRRI